MVTVAEAKIMNKITKESAARKDFEFAVFESQ
jgi:hypothetical protein